MAGVKPVVDGGADVADMNLARRRRGKPYSYFFCHGRDIIPFNGGKRTTSSFPAPLSHFFWGDLSQFSKKPNKTL